MRLGLTLLATAGLAACSVATPTETSLPDVATPFLVPMDPGDISCSSLSNPVALNEATNWALGRARAAVISGRLQSPPEAAAVSQSLSAFCSANSTSKIASAAAQLGF